MYHTIVEYMKELGGYKKELEEDRKQLEDEMLIPSTEISSVKPSHEQIKARLEEILRKIHDNGIGAWNGDLEDTIEAVAIEDHYNDTDSDQPTTVYNGWLDDLEQLIKSL